MSAILYFAVALATLLVVRLRSPISWRAAGVLLLLPLCLAGEAILTGGVAAPIDLAYLNEPLASYAESAGIDEATNPALSDVYAQFLPWHAAVRYALAHREWPLWNPFEMCGNVLAGAAQAAPYHPVHLLAGLIPLADGVTFSQAMTYFLAALSMFLFLRELAACELAASFGAAAWMLSTHLVSYAGTAHADTLSLLPLVLLGARRVARSPGIGSATLLAIALILATLSGHPETLLHLVALGVAYVVFELAGTRAARLGAVVFSGLAAGIGTLLLCAFYLLPIVDAIPQTMEYRHRAGLYTGRHPTARLDEIPHRLRVDFLPFVEGISGKETALEPVSVRHSDLLTGYAGAMLFAPALYVFARRRDRVRWFLAGALIWGWLTGIEAPGITDLLAHLPPFSLALNTRMSAFAAFAICALAALGIDAWLRDSESGPIPLLWKLYAAAAIAITGTVLLLSPQMIESGLSPGFIRLCAIREVVPLLLAASAIIAFRTPQPAAAGLLALLLVQRITEMGGLVPTLERRAFYPPVAGLEFIARDGEPFRIVGQGDMLTPNIATHYGLEDARGYDAMTFAPLRDTYPLWSVHRPIWSNRVDDLTRPFLSALSVRYALAPLDAPLPDGWRLAGSYPGYRLLENPRVLGRAFIPRRVHLGVPPASVLPAMAACPDFGRECWIESNDRRADLENGRGTVSVRRHGTGLDIQATMPSPAWIVISEPAWRGWRAVENGRELPLLRADHAFLGLHLPAGEHRIALVYRPSSFTAGAAISLVTALAIAAGFFVRRRGRKS
ncbi:MAG TPA: YfhO family protein, partial [Thermoanaerobaculia bacterium]|nr:YfhO family protein [Thermoanaerobaculia bacterium]